MSKEKVVKREDETRKDYLFRVAVKYLELLEGYADAMSETIIFDEAECDGCCLLEDMKNEM